MTRDGAERAVTISALIVAGVYIYRRMTEGAGTASSNKLAQLAGQGSPAPTSVFITGWGFAFLVISTIASASPGFGGALAILVATGDVLANTSQVAQDVNTKLGAKTTSATKPTSGAQQQAVSYAGAAGVSGPVSALTPAPS